MRAAANREIGVPGGGSVDEVAMKELAHGRPRRHAFDADMQVRHGVNSRAPFQTKPPSRRQKHGTRGRGVMRGEATTGCAMPALRGSIASQRAGITIRNLYRGGVGVKWKPECAMAYTARER